MTAKQFIKDLKKELNKYLTKSEVNLAVTYYDEQINDRLDIGEVEDEIIHSLGDVRTIAKTLSIDAIEKRGPANKIKNAFSSFLSLLKLAKDSISVFVLILFGIIMFALVVAFASLLISFLAFLVVLIVNAIDSISLALANNASWGVWFVIFGVHVVLFGIFLIVASKIKQVLYFLTNKALNYISRLSKKQVIQNE